MMDKLSSVSESLSSSHSLSAPFSIRSQTKDKFDSLLKKAQKKKAQSVSKEKLLSDLESNASESHTFDNKNAVETINLKELNSEGSYILSKFLEEESITSEKEVSSVKPPVPKPRQKKVISPTASQGTFNVTSPKFLKSEDEKDSSSSKRTYDINKVVDVLVHKSSNSNSVTINKKNEDLKVRKHTSKESTDLSDTDDEKIEIVTEVIEPIEKIEKVKNKDEQTDTKKNYKYKNIIEICIHRTDRLELDSLVIHPVVKIHIIDAVSGKYLSKSDTSRSVVFFYENDDNDYISPVMTHSYNLQEKRILHPSWEENILINEDYEYFKDESSRIIIFFEILDFVSAQMMQTLKNKNCSNGWHKIAFAFFKLSGKDGTLNMGKRVRLQLYHSSQSKKSIPQVCEPWSWWKKKKLKKYPSTLHVSIKSTTSPVTVVESFRSKTPIQRESSSKTKLCDDLLNEKEPEEKESIHSSKPDLGETVKLENSNWSRKSGEICKLPNKSLTEFNSYDCGCFVMKFSNAGKYLACAVQIDNLFYVVVYSILTLREVNKLSPHQALIYDIKWSHDDSLLLSASADNTVSIFDITTWSFLQILPHPNFVYSCDIRENVIASGCFDGTVRIWSCLENNAKIIDFRLTQELEAHSGYVTTLCFSKKGIFSADSLGIIIEWHKEKSDWIQKRQISLLDLKETLINQILLFAKERKLIVNSRDNIIRIVDIKSGCVLQWLRGGLNRRFQMFCSVSPCDNFIFNGSENGLVHVWNAKNGHQVATYSPFLPKNQFTVIHCVNFHPHDNILTISHYGKSLPILIYSYDSALSQPSVNLTINEEIAFSTEPTNDKAKKTLQKITTETLSLRRKTQDKASFRDVLEKMDIVITSSK